MKTRSVFFQPFQICERITSDTALGPLSTRVGRLHTFPAWRGGYVRFGSRSANEPAERLTAHFEAVFRESLPDLFERLSRTQGKLNLRQKRTQQGSLGGRRFLSEFLQCLPVEVWT